MTTTRKSNVSPTVKRILTYPSCRDDFQDDRKDAWRRCSHHMIWVCRGMYDFVPTPTAMLISRNQIQIQLFTGLIAKKIHKDTAHKLRKRKTPGWKIDSLEGEAVLRYCIGKSLSKQLTN